MKQMVKRRRISYKTKNFSHKFPKKRGLIHKRKNYRFSEFKSYNINRTTLFTGIKIVVIFFNLKKYYYKM